MSAETIPDAIRETAKSISEQAWMTRHERDLMFNTIARAIHEAVMAERERDQWQPIETAPKDGSAVDLWGVSHLHYAKTGRRATNVTWGRVRDWMGNERDDWQHGQGEDFEPTHWMPLPAAPKGDK